MIKIGSKVRRTDTNQVFAVTEMKRISAVMGVKVDKELDVMMYCLGEEVWVQGENLEEVEEEVEEVEEEDV